MRLVRSLLLMAVLAAAGLVAAQPASAHAVLLSSAPGDGQVVAAASEVVLVFNEPVSPISARLVSPGREDEGLAVRAEGDRVLLALPAGLAQGTHLVSYRVVSTDGHPIGGSLVFSLGQAGAAPGAAPTTDTMLAGALVSIRALLYGAMMFGVGSLAFSLLAPLPHAGRWLGLALSSAGLVLVPVALGLQGLDVLGRPLPDLFAPDSLAAGAATSYGATLEALALGFSLAIAGLLATGREAGQFFAVLALAAAALAPALSGHASTAAPQWLTRPAVAGHVAAALFWLGALVPLALALRAPAAVAAPALRRFSAAIPYAVLVLLVCGMALTAVQLGAPGPAWFTPYAAILAAKLALVAGLLLLAVWNRFALTRPALAGDAAATRRLRRSIVAETSIAVLILVLVAGWRVTPPPRALAALEARPIETVLAGNAALSAELGVLPGRAGPVVLTIGLTQPDGGAAPAPKAVSISLSQPERDIEPVTRQAVPEGGRWRVEGLVLPAGRWTVSLDIRVDDFTLVVLAGEVTLAP